MTYQSKIMVAVATKNQIAIYRNRWFAAKQAGLTSRPYWRNQYIKTRRALHEFETFAGLK